MRARGGCASTIWTRRRWRGGWRRSPGACRRRRAEACGWTTSGPLPKPASPISRSVGLPRRPRRRTKGWILLLLEAAVLLELLPLASGVADDRKRLVQGKGVSVRLDLGGRSFYKTNKMSNQSYSHVIDFIHLKILH